MQYHAMQTQPAQSRLPRASAGMVCEAIYLVPGRAVVLALEQGGGVYGSGVASILYTSGQGFSATIGVINMEYESVDTLTNAVIKGFLQGGSLKVWFRRGRGSTCRAAAATSAGQQKRNTASSEGAQYQ